MTLNEYVGYLNDLVGYGFGEKEVEHVRMIGKEDSGRAIILTNDSIYSYDINTDTIILTILPEANDKFTEKHLEDINKSEEEIIELVGDRKTVFALMKSKGEQLAAERQSKGSVSELEVLKDKYFNKKPQVEDKTLEDAFEKEVGEHYVKKYGIK